MTLWMEVDVKNKELPTGRMATKAKELSRMCGLKLLSLLPDAMNVWVYTGFEYEEIKDRPLAKLADVLVTGPFIENLKCEGQMYGSSNQEIHRRNNT